MDRLKKTNNNTIIRHWLCDCRHVLRIVIQQASSQADKKLFVVRVPMECNIRNSSKRNQSYRPVSLLISRILEKRKKCLETKCYFYKPILHLKCLSKRKHKKVETRIKKVYLEWFSKWILRNNKTLVSISCGFWSDWIACTSYATITCGILWNIAVADPNLELSGDGDRGGGV